MKTIDEIEIEFRNQILIPSSKPNKQFILCPVGMVGSGKTTVIKPLAEKFFLVRLSGDELRKILKENGYGYESVKDIIFRIAEEFIKKGFSVAMDMNCSHPLTKEFLNNLTNTYEIIVLMIHVNPPEEYIINKLKNYNHTWLFKDSNQAIENYYTQKKRVEGEINGFEYLYTIDPSRTDFQDQLNELYNLIKVKVS